MSRDDNKSIDSYLREIEAGQSAGRRKQFLMLSAGVGTPIYLLILFFSVQSSFNEIPKRAYQAPSTQTQLSDNQSTPVKASNGTETDLSLYTNDSNGGVPEALIVSEELPRFPGGTAAMYQFIMQNMRYPSLAQQNRVEGEVYVRFIVKKDGSISDVMVVRGIGYGCDEEAIRLVKAMPKWIAGKNEGKSVDVYSSLSISFKII